MYTSYLDLQYEVDYLKYYVKAFLVNHSAESNDL